MLNDKINNFLVKYAALQRSDFDIDRSSSQDYYDAYESLARPVDKDTVATQSSTITNPSFTERHSDKLNRAAFGLATLGGAIATGAGTVLAAHTLGKLQNTPNIKSLSPYVAGAALGGLGLAAGSYLASKHIPNTEVSDSAVLNVDKRNKVLAELDAQDHSAASSIFNHKNYDKYVNDAYKHYNDAAYNAYKNDLNSGKLRDVLASDIDVHKYYTNVPTNKDLLYKHFGKDTFTAPYDTSTLDKTSSYNPTIPDREQQCFNAERPLGCDPENTPDRTDVPDLDGTSNSIMYTAQLLDLDQELTREALDRAAGVKTASRKPEVDENGNYKVKPAQHSGRSFLANILAGTKAGVGDWATPGINERYDMTTHVDPRAYQFIIPEYRR